MIDYTKLKLSHNKLLVRPLAESDKVEGLEFATVYKPEESRNSLRGIVVAKGPGVLNERGDRIPIDMPIGALVFFGKYAGLDLVEGSGYILLSDLEATCWLEVCEFIEVYHEDFKKNHLEGEGCELCRAAEKPAHDAFIAAERERLLAAKSEPLMHHPV